MSTLEQIRKAHNETIDQAEKVFNETMYQAWKTYAHERGLAYDNSDQALRAYDEAAKKTVRRLRIK